MYKKRSVRIIATALTVVLLLSMVVSATLSYDVNGDGKTDISDLFLLWRSGAAAEEQKAAMNEVLGGGDELHKNAEGHWEIWTSLGLYNMAKNAEVGDTFVLMQDIDMEGALWTPVENFNGTFMGSEKYSVSNMKITQSVNGNMGFFGSVSEGGKVEYLNLKDINLIVAADATSIGFVAGTCSGKINACTAIGFLTDERTTLPSGLVVGGLVGTLRDTGEIATDVENMLHAVGKETEIPNISVKLGLRAAEADAMPYKKLAEDNVVVGHKGNGTVDAMALLEYLGNKMPDPAAIAWVQNGDVTTYPLTVNDMQAQVNSDGNSLVTLQADIVHNTTIVFPYSCTIDMNGYSVCVSNKVNCIEIKAAGSDNKTTTIKNGTVYHYDMGIRVSYGAVVAQNMKFYGEHAPAVGIYDPSPEYNDIHLIEDCELYNAITGVFGYNRAGTDFSGVNITIQRSKLVSYKTGGSPVVLTRVDSTGGTVTIGYDVEMYTYGSNLASKCTIAGVDPVLLETSENVNVDGVVYNDMKHWTTSEELIATEVIAEVTNGDKTVQVTNTKAMADAVSATGNTQIKLLKDITCTAQLILPYSCTVDLNNFSITNNSNTALRFAAVGTQNKVASVKNGTVNHYGQGVLLDTGSINISNVRFNSLHTSSSVCFMDPNGAYRANNKIDNCYIYNPKGSCINWNVKNVDFSNTGVTITNSTLISANGYVFAAAWTTQTGIIDLGEHVELYGKNDTIAFECYRYCGLMAGKTENVTVTVEGTDITHTLNKWSTDKQNETVNVLMLGNSLSTAIPEELYQIAKRDGIQLTIGDLYHPGAFGWEHEEWIKNNSDEYVFRIYNDMGLWYHGDIESVPNAIDYLEWSHVSYQDFIIASQAKTYEEAVTKYAPHVEWVVNYLKTEIPDAKFYMYEHWAWQVGHSTVKDVATQTEMFEVLRSSFRYFNDMCDTILIPCGEAWQLARADSLIGDTLCMDDYLHDNAPTGGQYLNGCVFYEVMFQKSCIGDTWRASNGPSEEKHVALQQYAHQAVAAVHGEDYAK